MNEPENGVNPYESTPVLLRVLNVSVVVEEMSSRSKSKVNVMIFVTSCNLDLGALFLPSSKKSTNPYLQ
jgi:hypothetical protein